MTSATLKFQTNLSRRFQLLVDLTSRKNDALPKCLRYARSSFGMSYAIAMSRNVNSQSELDWYIESEITRIALNIANDDGVRSAEKFLQSFDPDCKLKYARYCINIDNNQIVQIDPKSIDKFIFLSTNKIHDIDTRSCYSTALRPLGVTLPLDKRGMLSILTLVVPAYEPPKIRSFDELKRFAWDFVSASWPLFDARILKIPLSYFNFGDYISNSTIVHDFHYLSGYGLERLTCRLLVLRILCGHLDSQVLIGKDFLIAGCVYGPKFERRIRSFLFDLDRKFDDVSLRLSDIQNPIEHASALIMFIRSYTSPFDFVNRLKSIYIIDKSVLSLINWDIFSEVIDKTSELVSEDVVGMAAILSEDGIVKIGTRLIGQYIPTGASTDVLLYARQCRSDGFSAFRFFHSFSKQHVPVRRAVFRYLLKPGTLDRFANTFPIENADWKSRDDAVNALGVKLDLVNYLKIRNILPLLELHEAEEDTRRRLRQIHFEAETSSGRIRVAVEALSKLIAISISEYNSQSNYRYGHRQPVDEHIRQALERREKEQIVGHLIGYICFNGRFAFDYLMSHLRHNLLRFRIEKAIDDALGGKRGSAAVVLKQSFATALAEFCTNWLTIDPSRSFIGRLREEMTVFLVSTDIRSSVDEEAAGRKIAEISREHFAELLTSCRAAWEGRYKETIVKVILEKFDKSECRSDTAIRDNLTGELERAFDDGAKWLSINDAPVRSQFGLKELITFEATNFSSAKTRRRPIVVNCYRSGHDSWTPVSPISDVTLVGALLEPLVQLVHNLLENSFGHSGLATSDTEISVDIIRRPSNRIQVRFSNNFDRADLDFIKTKMSDFRAKVHAAMTDALNAPLQTGGSGVRRIVFELRGAFGDSFKLYPDRSMLKHQKFVVVCEFSDNVGGDNDKYNTDS